MKNSDITLTCVRCKGRFPSSEMHYAPNGKDLMCKQCYEIAKQARKQETDKTEVIIKEIPKSNDIIEYICTSCNYKFKKKLGQKVLKCPYCNSPNIEKYKALDASAILDEVSKMR